MNSLGIFSWFGYSLPLKQRLKLIKQTGFTDICLWFGNDEKTFLDGQKDQMVDLALDQGLVIDNIHADYKYANFLWSESIKEKEIIKAELADGLLYCSKHKIPIIVMHITDGSHPPPITKSGLTIIEDLVVQAEGLGITMAIENTRRPEYVDVIFSNIHSHNLGFCYDSSHDFLPGQSKGNVLKKVGITFDNYSPF
jgi:sugar phosphate isomerase/epimerase